MQAEEHCTSCKACLSVGVIKHPLVQLPPRTSAKTAETQFLRFRARELDTRMVFKSDLRLFLAIFSDFARDYVFFIGTAFFEAFTPQTKP